MKVRHKLGRALISLGIRVYGPVEENKAITTEVKEAMEMPLDAAVEVQDMPLEWQPKQHGNVIIAEPPLMRYARKQGYTDDDM